MRRSILLPLLLLACSGDTARPGYAVIPSFLEIARPLRCDPVDLQGTAVERLHAATDTTFLILDAPQRRISEIDDQFRLLWSLTYDERGPAGVDRPVDAVLLGDTAVAVAARGGLRLVILDRGGRLITREPLPFIPNALSAGDDGDVWITAMPVGSTPDSLLFRFHRGKLQPIPVPRRSYTDMTVGALGNATLVESLPDGPIVLNQFFAPRAFRFDPDNGSLTRLIVPTPDATLRNLDFVPQPPVTSDQFSRMLTPALATTADRGRGEVFVLTRSGRTIDHRPQRAVLRLDTHLGLRSAYVLNVHAVHMALLARRRALLVADDTDAFHLCRLDVDADGA